MYNKIYSPMILYFMTVFDKKTEDEDEEKKSEDEDEGKKSEDEDDEEKKKSEDSAIVMTFAKDSREAPKSFAEDVALRAYLGLN